MLLHYYTHSILFWFTLSIVKPNGSLIKDIQEIDFEYLPKEVCIAQCLKSKKSSQMTAVQVPPAEPPTEALNNNTFLEICRDDCVTLNSTQKLSNASENVKQIYENYKLDLVCRDESSLNFFVDLQTNNKGDTWNDVTESATFSNATTAKSTLSEPSSSSSSVVSTVTTPSYDDENDYETVFVITFHPANGSEKFVGYLSDDNFFTIEELIPNTTYNITVMAVHSNNQYSIITQQQQFRTLSRRFTPGNVTEIKVTNFTEDNMHLSATLTWKPPADKTCQYDIICFSPGMGDYLMPPLEIRNPRQRYKYQLENLTFSSLYQVGIRSKNTKNMKESALVWKTFQPPSCAEWYNYNFNICSPESLQNLNIEETYIDKNIYSLNINWQLPDHLPDNYTLSVQDISEEGKLVIFNLTKEIHQFFIPHIEIHGSFYQVSLTAYTRGGQTTTTSFMDLNKNFVHIQENKPFILLFAIILAPIFCFAILSLTIFMIYHRRAKLKRYQERCKYFEELEKKAPIDPKDNFDFNKHKSIELQYQLDADDMTLVNDQMEIDRTQLTLREVLGEGAFGLVKRGIYNDIKEGTAHEVAVKMLKDHPSTDDVRAFRREIEVMKSVEKHPNIVGIIGHCTSYGNEMMLLTEYCSFGNLLNFLRDEWRFLHELQQKKQTLTSGIVEVELPHVSEKQIGELQKHFKYVISHRKPSPHAINGGLMGRHDEGYRKFKDDCNTNDDFVKHFKKKYNDFSVKKTAATTTVADTKTTTLTNCVSSNTNKNQFQGWQVTLKHEEVLNKSTTTPQHSTQNDATLLTQVSNDQLTSQTTVLSSAAENKSYGYHGCCTNSCKCDVDVVIRNIESTDTNKDNEELERLLRQQHHNSQQQSTTSCCTTIQVKNCNCKNKEHRKQLEQQHHQQQPEDDSIAGNSAVENKTYFKMFQKATQPLPPQAQHIAKVKIKTKPPLPPPAASTTTTNSEWAALFERVPLSSGDLLDIARQVAVGMDFLAKNKVVHRDLAARNVLVSPDRTVKIADFGLSRDVYQENMYKKIGNGKLPIKWLALESMTHQVYTTQSDVWSYGILLYEIVTLGATPYPSIPTNRLLHLLKTGYRMERPKNCGKEFYDLMSACWNSVPNERPTFNEIIKKLDNMLNAFNHTPTFTPNDEDYIKDDNNLSIQESPIQQICSDDSYLKPL